MVIRQAAKMESITARLDALENENKFYKRVFSAAMQAAGE